MIYLNWRGPQGRETVDQIDPRTYATKAAFRAEVIRLIREYAIAGMLVYASSRACRGWA